MHSTVRMPDGREVPARLPGLLRRDLVAGRLALAVGDRVEVECDGGRSGRRDGRSRGPVTILSVAERENCLSRPMPGRPHRRQIIAANIDGVVVMASIREPDFVPGLVDRYLVASRVHEVPALLVISKWDLARDGDLERLSLYDRPELPMHRICVPSGEGLPALEAELRGRRCVLVGHSGVGKSSLLCHWLPDERVEIAAISEATGKGRHTTSFVRLYEIAPGTEIIDTPGIRELGLWGVGSGDLAASFPEFGTAGPCRFSDCAHRREPRCAVREAAQAGRLPEGRYESYLRLLESLVEEESADEKPWKPARGLDDTGLD